MKFKLDSKLLPYSLVDYRFLLRDYPFTVEDGSDLEVEWRKVVVNTDGGLEYPDEEYPFPLSQYGVLITDCDNYYRGLTKPYGQTSVYWNEDDIKKTKLLRSIVLKLRIVHEVAHHFGLPCHDIDKWIVNYPFLYLLWTLGGRGKRYSLLDCICQECYYQHLFEGFSEDAFNKEYNMSNRMPNGVLITEDKHTNE